MNRFFTILLLLAVTISAQARDPLPSWNEGSVKQSILAFVQKTTTPGPDFVADQERVAVFDNDGTLWTEQPFPEVAFALARVRELAGQDPTLAAREPFRSILNGGPDVLTGLSTKDMVALLSASHSGMTQDRFAALVKDYLATARQPKLGMLYTRATYLPMRELMDLLRARGFSVWICSGGTSDFIRVFSQEIYGVPPENVIGTLIDLKFENRGDGFKIWRLPDFVFVNDKDGKPVGITRQIGRQPVFAAGNVRSGGDIAMLTFTQSRPGTTFQLMVNHDDAQREFAYAEADGASLKAARTNRWTVVSMKKDWKKIFDF